MCQVPVVEPSFISWVWKFSGLVLYTSKCSWLDCTLFRRFCMFRFLVTHLADTYDMPKSHWSSPGWSHQHAELHGLGSSSRATLLLAITIHLNRCFSVIFSFFFFFCCCFCFVLFFYVCPSLVRNFYDWSELGCAFDYVVYRFLNKE